MNKTHLEHAIIAIIIQIVTYLITGSLVWGATIAIAVFVAREHAQREYEISNPADLIGYEAFDFWCWSLDSKLDLLTPTVSVILIALIGM